MSKGNTMSKSRTYTYDSCNGLLSSRTMPGGKTCNYTYDTYGNTTDVDFESGTIAWSYAPNDFYYYSVEYGPDLQRVWTQLDKTYNNEYSKYYWDDYEEKTTGSLTTRYWYINGPDGLIGIYIEEQTPNGTVSIPTVAATDHLGSIEGLFGNNNYCYYAARYDEWGDRDVMLLYGLSHGFDRGYTGHEHIDGLGLINMNGRMYDPNLGRFLSPDPYVQAPGNPQNYNRYSYCLNNPLKYTDPDGEFWHLIIGGLIGGTINWISNDCKGGKEGFKYWIVGAIGGSVGAGVGAGISSALAGGSFGAGFIGSKATAATASSFLSDAAIQGGSSFSNHFITDFGNSLINGSSMSEALCDGTKSGIIKGLTGALYGGILGGFKAYRDDRNFWNGKLPQSNNENEDEIWGNISIKARGKGYGSSSTDGHSWIEITDNNGETTSYATWGNQGNQEFFINYKGDLGSSYDAIQTQTITKSQKLRFDNFISNPRNIKWSLFRNCSFFSSRAFYYTTGLNVIAHPYRIPIYTPSWFVRNVTK